MEDNRDNQGTSASRRDEKTVNPSNNSDRDFVNQTGKSQNSGNDSDYLIDPNSKAKPENLAEGSEFLNDVIDENNPSREKEVDTKEFYDHANTMTGNSNTGNSNTGNSSWSTGNSGTSDSGTRTSNSGTGNSGTNTSTNTHSDLDSDDIGSETGNSGSQNNMDQAPKSYDYIDPQDQRSRNNSSDTDEDSEEMGDQRGRIKPTLIDENFDALEQLQVGEK